MSDQTAGTRSPDARTVGRNAGARRRVCGLSASEAAARGGISVGWVEALEEGTAAWNLASLSRLAWSLDTTVGRLLAADYDPSDPPPRPDADRSTHGIAPELTDMGEEECYARLALGNVGRLSPGNAPEPFVVPVNYLVDGRDIVLRTKPGSLPSTVSGKVAFEVDDLVQSAHLGWSVLVVGAAEQVHDDVEEKRLDSLGLVPWAGGDRTLWMRIRPDRVTGRRIAPARTAGDVAP
ncbi:helix-turn-helix domain-containing protein [Yinghuangia seranimata]|uniref:helix-turn-helix domain-containing protein n=1 Tax=Yinghuangia seranimata TaxID=408067 RepID=UPI00248BEFA7|nr:pyridoxamine 5'-phosphate oxidase family protein [Yinghuangia seranimata]MDI2124787.1 pyridoxamine 5'-phosphate oxidase family protein [Yinghuangia seranimata]